MPNRNILIAAAAAVILIVAAGGAYFMFGRGQKAPETPTTAVETQEESSSKSSIAGLLASGKNQTCTVNYPAGDQITTGTVYISGKNVRGDFSSTVEAQNIEYHMITDGEFLYSWSSTLPQGIKIKIDPTQPSPSPAAGQVDLNTEVDVKCSSWSVDNSKFTPPADVTFREISVPSTTTQSPSTQNPQGGSPCDSITDPQAKAACLQYSR